MFVGHLGALLSLLAPSSPAGEKLSWEGDTETAWPRRGSRAAGSGAL